MKEIKFYNGGIANFTTLKNENYFYVRAFLNVK